MNLRCLLKRDSYRKLLLIETLYYAKRPKTADQLMQVLGCTPPALSRYVQLINQNKDKYFIRRENGLYLLEVADHVTMDEVFSCFIRQSLSFNILEQTLFEEYFTLKKLAKRLNSSISALQVYLAELDTVLARWGLKLERKPYRISGDEKAVRQLFFLLFSEKKLRKDELRCSTELFERGEAVIRSLIHNNQFECSYAHYVRLRTMFFISLERVRHGNFFPKALLKNPHIVPPDPYVCWQFAEKLWQEAGIDYSQEVMKDSFWLLYADLLLLGEQQKKQALATNYFLSKHYTHHYQLVKQLSDLLIDPLSDKQKHQLTTQLINHSLYHIDTPEYISVLRDIQQEYGYLLERFHPHCVHKIRQMVEQFAAKQRCFQSTEFINHYVYQIVSTVPECLSGMQPTTPLVRLLIVTTDSTNQERLLTQMIQSSLQGNYTLSHIPYFQLEQTNYLTELNQHDLIICSFAISLPPYCRTPFFALEPCPSTHKMNKLQQLVETIFHEKAQKRNGVG